MSAYFDALVEHDAKIPKCVSDPARAVVRDMITTSGPSEYELTQLSWGQKLNGPFQPSMDAAIAESPIELTPAELEQSLPPTPKQAQAVEAIVQTAFNPYKNRWRLASVGVIFFLLGLNDGATGALIPYIERYYNIGYAIVSLVFVTYALGFISAAPFTQMIDAKWGRSKALMLSCSLLTVGYIILATTPPFPLVVTAFFCLGFGMSLFLAMTNVFIVNLLNGTVILGFMHGLYGIGGTIAPLVATAIVTKNARWSFFYLIPLGLAALSIGLTGWSYIGYEDDASTQLLSALEKTASKRSAGEPGKFELLRRAFKHKTTLLGALFIFFYQGSEVAISGWVISYLINYRHGQPSKVGNVTSGFWGGITVGRFVLTHFAHKIGEKTSMFGLIIGAAALQLLVWLIPDVIGPAIAESLVGLLLGPVYPLATALVSRLLPRNLQIASLSFITSMGSSGGAFIPFMTGLLAQKVGTVVLHPIVLVSFVVMNISLALLPRIIKRIE